MDALGVVSLIASVVEAQAATVALRSKIESLFSVNRFTDDNYQPLGPCRYSEARLSGLNSLLRSFSPTSASAIESDEREEKAMTLEHEYEAPEYSWGQDLPSRKWPPRRDFRSLGRGGPPIWQNAARTGILLAIPVPALVINLYALETGLACELPRTLSVIVERVWRTTVVSVNVDNNHDGSQWQPEISQEGFALAAVVLTVLVGLHRRLRSRHDCGYDGSMTFCIGAALAIGGWAGMSAIAMILCLVPWAAYVAAVWSDLVSVFGGVMKSGSAWEVEY